MFVLQSLVYRDGAKETITELPVRASQCAATKNSHTLTKTLAKHPLWGQSTKCLTLQTVFTDLHLPVSSSLASMEQGL